MGKKGRQRQRWFMTNTVLGAVVVLLCTFIYLYEHRSGYGMQTGQYTVDDQFAEHVNAFTFRTAKELFHNRVENTVYSPVSLYYTLSLAACGADGETATQLNTCLGTKDFHETAEQAGWMRQSFYADSDIAKLNLATSIWKEKGLKLKSGFKNMAKENFDTPVYSVDFGKKSSVEKMEAWVQKQTRGTVKPQIITTPDDVLHILNTIYFYDEWRDRFGRGVTKTGTFYLQTGETTEADFMIHHYDIRGFSKGDGFTRASITLKETGAMYFILPDEGVSLDSFFESDDRLREAFEGGTSEEGEITFKIPRFSIDSSLDVKELMRQEGMDTVFSFDGDFSNMSEDDVYISSLKQDSHISINEDGVEASAFTEISMIAAAAIPEERKKIEFVLDRPFLFGVKYGDFWIFAGVCDNPTAN